MTRHSLDLCSLILKEQATPHLYSNDWMRQRKHVLRELQSLPLKTKILLTQSLIKEAIKTFGCEYIYISFSGGKDSTGAFSYSQTNISRNVAPICGYIMRIS